MKKLIIISPYPSKGATYDNKYSALASFVKNKAEAIRKLDKMVHMIILADKIPGATPWKDNNIEVKRTWERKKLSSYFSLFSESLKYKDIKKVLINLEWGLFGNSPIMLGLMPLFISLLRLVGKEVYITMHGVTLDFFAIAPQIGLLKKSIKARLFHFSMRIFYLWLIIAATKVIVLEKYFADLFNKAFHTDKVVFIPHGVDTQFKSMGKNAARKKLKMNQTDFIILYFGFINWYKGTDIIVERIKNQELGIRNKKVKLIIAGGGSLIHRSDETYKKYVDGIKNKVNQSNNIQITGYIPERQIPLYFSAADLVVFPYRLFISSSGPLSLAFSFEKPVLLSDQLKGYLKSTDFQKSLKESKLMVEDAFTSFTKKELISKILFIKKNYSKFTQFSALMKLKRSWRIIAKEYLRALDINTNEY